MDDLFATLQGANPQQQSPPAPQPAQGFDPTKSYGTPPQLLNNLNHTESSGNNYAVNDKTGAMGPYQFTPSTLAMLRKQGVAFDPFDPVQARNAADWYIQQLKQQNGGTYEGALKAYGGFVTKDPSQYVSKVMNGVAPQPTIPGQSNSGAQPQGYTGPTSDLFSTLQAGTQAAQKGAQAPASAPPPPPSSAPTPSAKQQAANSAFGLDPISSAVDSAAVHGLSGLAGGIAGMGAGALKALTTGGNWAAANQAWNQTAGKVGGAIESALTPAGNATAQGVGRTAVDVPGSVIGGAVNAGANALGQGAQALGVSPSTSNKLSELAKFGSNAALTVAGTRGMLKSMPEPAQGAADASAQAAPGSAPASAQPPVGAPAVAAAGARGSVGAAGTSFAEQARAEGVPDAIVQKIAAQEQKGQLNPTAAARHIEAGSLPVPVELTAGQATGDVNLMSQEQNMRGKIPELAQRFNAQNGQLAANLDAIRDQAAPDVNVPSGAGIGQALVDAYKQADAPMQQQISEAYAGARNADGTSALVNTAPTMLDFESQIGPTRFRALPSRVQQIFQDAKNNSVTLPGQFDQSAGPTRPLTARDLMDIDQTLSGAIAETKNTSVQHDIGQLRDAILGAPLDPSAGADAMAAFKTAQAQARTRFQAMEADPAYKAAINDVVPAGEPSPLADQFVQKYVAGGKAAAVRNMGQNLSGDPLNQQLMAAGLLDHIKQQAGIDLRTNTGNVSQAGLNKALTNLDQKTGIVLGAPTAQTLDTLGNVARYTQEQPRGSFVNNSNTAVTLMSHASNLTKSAVERGVNAFVPGAQLGSWGRETLAKRATSKAIARSLEPGAGMKLSRLSGSRPFGD
jgi:hypothetical protein